MVLTDVPLVEGSPFRGKRQLESSRTRRTEWLASQLRDLSDADRARLAAALDVLERVTAARPAQREVPAP